MSGERKDVRGMSWARGNERKHERKECRGWMIGKGCQEGEGYQRMDSVDERERRMSGGEGYQRLESLDERERMSGGGRI